ncbi:DMP19 family protein [Planctomicrobium sp. SH664]|uniref:DMP19 family protein n=1 Tax=Planctomicrobium sp. SH664 TaxID=3448125 RepID=UPI003F5C24D3
MPYTNEERKVFSRNVKRIARSGIDKVNWDVDPHKPGMSAEFFSRCSSAERYAVLIFGLMQDVLIDGLVAWIGQTWGHFFEETVAACEDIGAPKYATCLRQFGMLLDELNQPRSPKASQDILHEYGLTRIRDIDNTMGNLFFDPEECIDIKFMEWYRKISNVDDNFGLPEFDSEQSSP